jgi:hypothetical protein
MSENSFVCKAYTRTKFSGNANSPDYGGLTKTMLLALGKEFEPKGMRACSVTQLLRLE